MYFKGHKCKELREWDYDLLECGVTESIATNRTESKELKKVILNSGDKDTLKMKLITS